MNSMHRYTKLLLASLTATALLAIAVGNASAAHLRISENNIRVAWASLELTNTVNSETVRCPVTLEGSFHERTITKNLGTLLGYITRASVGSCTGGTATIHQTSLPWHITYEGFRESLPNIRSIIILLTEVEFEIRERGGNTCTARTEAEHPAQGIVNENTTTHAVESLTAEAGKRIPLTNGNGGIFCGLANGIFSGTSNVPTILGSTTGLTVTLI